MGILHRIFSASFAVIGLLRVFEAQFMPDNGVQDLEKELFEFGDQFRSGSRAEVKVRIRSVSANPTASNGSSEERLKVGLGPEVGGRLVTNSHPNAPARRIYWMRRAGGNDPRVNDCYDRVQA